MTFTYYRHHDSLKDDRENPGPIV